MSTFDGHFQGTSSSAPRRRSRLRPKMRFAPPAGHLSLRASSATLARASGSAAYRVARGLVVLPNRLRPALRPPVSVATKCPGDCLGLEKNPPKCFELCGNPVRTGRTSGGSTNQRSRS